MYKIYFKQAIQMLKQNKFISIISILGTALAIMMIMALIVTDEVKTANAAPEINRDRTLYIAYQVKRDTTPGKNSWQSGQLEYDIMQKYLLTLQTPEYVSYMNEYDPEGLSTVNKEGSNNYQLVSLRTVDAAFWKIYSFDFVDGSAFSKEESDAGIHNAVISESTARNIFKDEKAVGKTIQIGFEDYKVTGVVKDVSSVFKSAAGDVWIPYNSLKNKANGYVVIMAKSKEDLPKIIAEVRDAEKKWGANHHPWFLYLKGPENQEVHSKSIGGNNEEEFRNGIKIENRKMVLIFILLLLIPALNLSGFSLSRIKKRTAEIGIRKAFGAKKYVILIQVLYENMITSLIGGVIGLLFSYIVIFWLREWLLEIPDGSSIPVTSLISLSIFIVVFIVCLLLNLLSAGISAFRASRMTIVDSLNQNDK
ncbi:ABC transporter permease [Dysgonomonas sp. 25]|uniref:ABC transporter permease n=1 Tax=Dysgonomonas sp. 25 TaxID=2302933 RepID=UPI0013D7F43E|nr:ABC transporter permease [Dysgonomonas sp. 25]NDV67877.1 ABC transporter permease [Dysgonomonas sp. 25]